MNYLELLTTLLDVARTITGLAINWLMQSTLLIACGLAVGYLLRHRGSAVQSAIYRTTFVAVLVSPLATGALSLLGVSGWSLNMPVAYSVSVPQTEVATASEISGGPSTDMAASVSGLTGQAALISAPAPQPMMQVPQASPSARPDELAISSARESNTLPSEATTPVMADAPAFEMRQFAFGATLIAGIWIFTTVGLLVLLVRSWAQLYRLRRGARLADMQTVAVCRRLAATMGVQPPEVLHSPYLPSPCLAGLRRPAVMLPETDVSLPIRDVLVHELAHLVRQDCFWNLARQAATAVLFFQPLLWKLSRRMAATAEEVCDDYVVQFGGDRREYAHRLVDIATLSVVPLSSAGVGIVSLRSMLATRVARILDTSRSLSMRVGNLALAMVLVAGLGATLLVGLVGLNPATHVAEAADATPSGDGSESASDSSKNDSIAHGDDADDVITVHGRVVDPTGKPVASADVNVLRWVWNFGNRTPLAETKTDKDGRFSIAYRKSQYFEDSGRPNQWREAAIIAFADGFGTGWVTYGDIAAKKEATIKLVVDVPIEGRILDLEGKPVAGAAISVDYLNTPKGDDLSAWLKAVREGQSIPAAARFFADSAPLFTAGRWQGIKTDADGRFRLTGIGRERQLNLNISGPTIVTRQLSVVTRDMPPLDQLTYDFPGALKRPNYGANFVHNAAPSRPIEGVVRDKKTGKPIPGVEIWSSQFAGEKIGGITTIRTKSDDNGHYVLNGMPKGQGNEIWVVPTELPYFTREFEIPDPEGIEPVAFDVDLLRGVWVSGKVVDERTKRGVPAQLHYIVRPDNPLAAGAPEFEFGRHEMHVQDRYTTKPDGSYRLVALPGRGIIGVNTILDVYPTGQGLEVIKGVEDRQSFTKYNGVFAPSKKSSTAVKEIEIPVDSDSTVCDFELSHGKEVTIRALDSEGALVSDCLVDGAAGVHGNQEKKATGEFVAVAMRDDEERTLLIYQEARHLGKALRIKASDGAKGAIEVRLEPCATVIGRLVDGDAAPVRGINLRMDVSGDGDYGKELSRATTDAEGRFRHEGFLPGLAYDILGDGTKVSFISVAQKLEVKPGETIDLGTIDVTSKDRPEMKRIPGGGEMKSSSPTAADKKTANEDATPLFTPETIAATKETKPAVKAIKPITSRVTSPDGKGISEAKVYLIEWQLRGQQSAPRLIATTDDKGVFEFTPPDRNPTTVEAMDRMKSYQMVVVAPGYGMAYVSPFDVRPQGALDVFANTLTGGTSGSSIQLPKEVPLKGRIVTIDGQPVPNARISIRRISSGKPQSDEAHRRELKAHGREQTDINWRLRLDEIANTFFPEELPHVAPTAKSGTDGWFELRGVGGDRMLQLLIEGDGVQSDLVFVRTSPGEAVTVKVSPAFGNGSDKLYGLNFTHVAGPSKPIEGRVLDFDTSQPIAGAIVRAFDVHGERLRSSRDRQHFAAVTDAGGRYRITGMGTGDDNSLVAFTIGAQPYVPSGATINTDVPELAAKKDFHLKLGVWAEGRAFDATTNKPLTGQLEYFVPRNPELEKAMPGMRKAFLDEHYFTDAEGKFRLPVLAARGIVTFRYASSDGGNMDSYARGIGKEKLTGYKGVGRVSMIETLPMYLIPENYSAVAEVEPKAGDTTVTVDFALSKGRPVTVEVLDDSGQTIARGLQYYGRSEMSGWQWADGAKCLVTDLKPGEKRNLFFYLRERNLVGSTSVDDQTKAVAAVKLSTGGGIRGRLVNAEGEPLAGARLSPIAEGPNGASWPMPKDLISNPQQIPINKDGKFEIDGLIPGKKYVASVIMPRKMNGMTYDMEIGRVFENVAIEAGKTPDLGDVVVIEQKPEAKKPKRKTKSEKSSAEKSAGAAERRMKIHGHIIGPDGKPAEGANVAVVGTANQVARGGDLDWGDVVLAETTTNAAGDYELSISGLSSAAYRRAAIVARTRGAGLAWRLFDPNASQVDGAFELKPEEVIRGHLADIEGKPAANVRMTLSSVSPTISEGRFAGGMWLHMKQFPAAWPASIVSDDAGKFEIHNVAAAHGVFISIEGDERVAPQSIALNTGTPEQRDERDATYRPQFVKNAKRGDEIVVPLAPAQIFEGDVTYADTGKPAPHARLTIWSSQQKYGSMLSLAGNADAAGHYRISAYPGIRFGITAYPPNGTAYLTRQLPPVDWEGGQDHKQMPVQLPRGVLVRGKVVELASGAPVARATIQYLPEEANNKNAKEDILTGWQGIELSNENGEFAIPVLPGLGRLLIHGPQNEFTLKETSSRELNHGTSGGQRMYAHAIERIDPKTKSEPLDLTIKLERGAIIRGKLLDDKGQPAEAQILSRLNIHPTIIFWRGDSAVQATGGHFSLAGLAPNESYKTYFLDAKHRIGATAVLKAGDESPLIALSPCIEAKARFVNLKGAPVSGFRPALQIIMTPGLDPDDGTAERRGELAADMDYVSNIDQINYRSDVSTDADGHITFPALIPGATYRIPLVEKDGVLQFKEFEVNGTETIDLGNLVVDVND